MSLNKEEIQHLSNVKLVQMVSGFANAGPWTINSLTHDIQEMKINAKRARGAYQTSESMTAGCEYLARAYEKARYAFEEALDLLNGHIRLNQERSKGE